MQLPTLAHCNPHLEQQLSDHFLLGKAFGLFLRHAPSYFSSDLFAEIGGQVHGRISENEMTQLSQVPAVIVSELDPFC